ncbi:MAG: TolC family protein [Pirellulales bacterium]|nr:TolC family protein [Pirellulales bacterium]
MPSVIRHHQESLAAVPPAPAANAHTGPRYGQQRTLTIVKLPPLHRQSLSTKPSILNSGPIDRTAANVPARHREQTARQTDSHVPQSHQRQPWISGIVAADKRFATGGLEFPPPSQPWWDELVQTPLQPQSAGVPIGLDELSAAALQFSSYVRVVSVTPHIRQAELAQQDSVFDWRTFLESTYSDVSDPIGNTLTTGNNDDRFTDRNWSLDAGVKRRTPYGGELELAQRFGTQNNNSRFLLPNPQRTTRLELQVTQPLLKGAGRIQSESQIVLAQFQVDKATEEVATLLESHLVKVAEAYWELYRSRAEFLQQQRLLRRAEKVLRTLGERRSVDAIQRQVFRARGAVARRKGEVVRAETAIRTWESQLRLLVNDPLLVQAGARELMPKTSPLLEPLQVDMADSLHIALINRSDISRAIIGVRTAAVQLGVAQKDILPKLDFVASVYVAGLAAEADAGHALGDQFSEGRPSVNLGLEFEIPLGNRTALAEADRRRWEMARATNQYRLVVEESLTAVEVAVHAARARYREMASKLAAVQALEAEAAYLEDRWSVLPGEGDSAAQLLENLLDAQERVSDEEAQAVRAQAHYAMALVQLKSELGTLLRPVGP